MIKAFGTQPCYFDGRDEGISDHTVYLDGVLWWVFGHWLDLWILELTLRILPLEEKCFDDRQSREQRGISYIYSSACTMLYIRKYIFGTFYIYNSFTFPPCKKGPLCCT